MPVEMSGWFLDVVVCQVLLAVSHVSECPLFHTLATRAVRPLVLQ